MTQEEVFDQQEAVARRQFEQNCRIRSIEVANSYTRTSDNPLMSKGKSLESLLNDAEKIYNWLIKK